MMSYGVVKLFSFIMSLPAMSLCDGLSFRKAFIVTAWDYHTYLAYIFGTLLWPSREP